ncbi:MAG TPA: VWA domain-containing protein [Blastocatellia bacterium]|nr:VWA domain-containing protein [Blastocatellia bacterium]
MKPAAISLFLALILTITSSAYSQDPQPATVSFSVLSKNTWAFVDGLKAADVSVDEDGEGREVVRLSSGEKPISMIILIDASGSMRSYLDLIKDVALEAINPLKPEDEVALIIFNMEAELIRDFTKDKKLIGAEIKKLTHSQVRQQTFLNKAVLLAAEHLRLSANANNRRLIILITDDRISKAGDEDKTPSRDEVRKELAESRAVLCGLIMPELKNRPAYVFNNRSKGPVSHYAEETGGVVLPVEENNARAKMNKMIDSFHKQYAVEYRPLGPRPDGKPRKIKLKISPDVEKREGGLIILSPRGKID